MKWIIKKKEKEIWYSWQFVLGTRLDPPVDLQNWPGEPPGVHNLIHALANRVLS